MKRVLASVLLVMASRSQTWGVARTGEVPGLSKQRAVSSRIRIPVFLMKLHVFWICSFFIRSKKKKFGWSVLAFVIVLWYPAPW